jgi:hypothetical protein
MNIRLQAAFPCFPPKTQLRKAPSFGRLYATVVLSGLPGQSQKPLRQSSRIGWIAATGRATKRVLLQVGGMGQGKRIKICPDLITVSTFGAKNALP